MGLTAASEGLAGLPEQRPAESKSLTSGTQSPEDEYIVTNFPFKHPVSHIKMDRQGLEDLLRSFEDAWADETGERITSAEFYDRYRANDSIDSMLAMAWSSYYEIFRRLVADSAHEDLVRSLAAAG